MGIFHTGIQVALDPTGGSMPTSVQLPSGPLIWLTVPCRFPNQQDTYPHRGTDSRRAGWGSLPDLCPAQLSESRSHRLSVTAANTFLHVRFLAASHMLSLVISWHSLIHRAFSGFRGDRSRSECPVRGAELTAIAGEADTPPNQRALVGGESPCEWREDLWVCSPEEGRNLRSVIACSSNES